MKKIINDPEQVVEEMLQGMVKAHPEYLKRVEGFNVVVRSKKPENKVALISGGGSGHEPSHGGYVGFGMLDGAIAGDVFTSPTPQQVFEAIKNVDNGNGILMVIKNYTGDVMNFEMAAEMAELEDIKVDKVIVNDDVAVEDSLYTTGRRGIAGTIFVHKIAGAAAESGKNLEEVKKVAEKVIANVRTMGMSLSPCIMPAVGKPGFDLPENKMEIGLGIHGEPGTHQDDIKSSKEIAKILTDRILEDMKLTTEDEIAVIINGLGGTPAMELYVANNDVQAIFEEKGLKVYKTIVGNYMTSLEMAGYSVSVLRLDDELKGYLNASANTIAYREL